MGERVLPFRQERRRSRGKVDEGDEEMSVLDDTKTKDMEAVRAEMEKLRADFASMGRTLKELAADVGTDAYARVREGTDKARQRAGVAAESVTHTIEDRPLTSVLTAFGVGLLLGVLFGRR
ncbi:MAG: DUF883 family protein [Rhodospirillales bacterium]|nr:DUF883 family protein [Rhodospirillales bacterium]